MATAGKSTKVYAKSSAPGSTTWTSNEEIDGFTEVTWSNDVDMLDTTDFKDTSGARTRMAGLSDGQVTMSGDFEASDTPQGAIVAYGSACWVGFNPAGSSGTNGYSVEGIVSNVERKAANEGKVTVSVTVSFNGAVSTTYTFP